MISLKPNCIESASCGLLKVTRDGLNEELSLQTHSKLSCLEGGRILLDRSSCRVRAKSHAGEAPCSGSPSQSPGAGENRAGTHFGHACLLLLWQKNNQGAQPVADTPSSSSPRGMLVDHQPLARHCTSHRARAFVGFLLY